MFYRVTMPGQQPVETDHILPYQQGGSEFEAALIERVGVVEDVIDEGEPGDLAQGIAPRPRTLVYGWQQALADARPGLEADILIEAIERPAPPIEARRHARWQEVKARRDVAELGGCMTPFGRVQTDQRSQDKINGMATMAIMATLAKAPFAQGFVLADNSVATLDAAKAQALAGAVGAHVAAVYDYAFRLRKGIEVSDDPASIDIDAGWPQ